MNLREAAYATIPELSLEDVAREMRVSSSKVARECRAGRLV